MKLCKKTTALARRSSKRLNRQCLVFWKPLRLSRVIRDIEMRCMNGIHLGRSRYPIFEVDSSIVYNLKAMFRQET